LEGLGLLTIRPPKLGFQLNYLWVQDLFLLKKLLGFNKGIKFLLEKTFFIKKAHFLRLA